MTRWIALAALALALPAGAVERIRLQAQRIEVAGVGLTGVDATLEVRSPRTSRMTLSAKRATLPQAVVAQAGEIGDLHIRCDNPGIREPLFACPALAIRAHSTRWGRHSLRGEASFRSDTGSFAALGGGIALAGAPLTFEVEGNATRLSARANLPGVKVTDLLPLVADQIPLLDDLAPTGRADATAHLTRRDGSTQLSVTASLVDAGYQNADYTWIGEKLVLALHADADLTALPWSVALRIDGTGGQALAGPVLLDFEQNPLTFEATGRYDGQVVEVTRFGSRQRGLAEAHGTARLRLDPFALERADVALDALEFPAAYSSYMQVMLTTTPLNQLVTSGRASAQVSIRDGLPERLDLTVHQLEFSDAAKQLAVTGVTGELHWTADITTPRASWLGWESSRGWGIVGARTRLDFTTSGRDFQLLQPARLPFFDGALLINTLAAEGIGTPQLSGVFDAVVEPISVAPIARALGWPEFPGQLSGRIPGLTYKDNLLSLQGNLEAEVFDGRVVAQDLRVRDPLGAWPRLYANITARNLDLDLITRTFEFGSITGRLDVDLVNLETFNWTPVAFDLSLATPAGDRSRHRISQRAVQNLSDIGGGGGGVAAALQSGLLRFFDDFGYDRLGLSCRLRNDVCEMGGAGPAGAGFYIVKGKGLPRIDIIGNNRRVDWPLLMQQVGEALKNPGGIAVQ